MTKIHTISDLTFLKPRTLYSWFKGGSPTGNGKFAVVDVRDSDFYGGHIKGCYHYPAGNFMYALPDLQEKLFTNQIDDVVFHCALSQVRGPSSTIRFINSLNDIKDPERQKYFSNLNVWVLRGGFTKWQEEYGEDSEVTEGYNKELWQGEY
ncbi:Rhodanese-like domain-containing protein [Scheffersomyces coipomensis]|uniref:Rhodanese-like domain-containing protein n=1 Tax=Scheffersomyces coipomensis TaxID=1788519 RepID=UPI00315C5142